jgi:thioredoxin 1
LRDNPTGRELWSSGRFGGIESAASGFESLRRTKLFNCVCARESFKVRATMLCSTKLFPFVFVALSSLAVEAVPIRQATPAATQPSVRILTNENFSDEVLNSRAFVLVFFWADWSKPAMKEEPIIEALAVEYAGKVKVAKLNIDEHPALSYKFNVRGLPTCLLFNDGKPVESIVGAASADTLRKAIDKHL